MKQWQKVLCGVGFALVLTPWGKIPEMIIPDVSGYHIGGGGLRDGYRVLEFDSSERGEMYSYSEMKREILNTYPFTYSSSFLSITLEFDDGGHAVLNRGWDGLLHCIAGSCGGMGNIYWAGESETDLPKNFQTELSKIKNRRIKT
ncbi:MAG: hypothetical protein RR736_19570 [Pseudomonas sp.]|uniref:hypothetical protein n=1 Tax=Pseudomonas sp. TaxID=306 RepID=UPI002FCC2E7D